MNKNTLAELAMNPDTLINRWNNLFATSVHDIQHEECLYIVTSGTGEGVFAYDASDFADGLEAAEAAHTEAYAAFCDACTPEVDEDLARAVYAATGLQICRGGSCSRVMDFDVEEDEEDINDCYVMTCASGAVVLVSAESAEQAEEAWDSEAERDECEPRVTGARSATRDDVDACVDSGHDYR